ncbi:MAG: hypothetical protein AAF503_03935 [Pseudomonadota bacterium]
MILIAVFVGGPLIILWFNREISSIDLLAGPGSGEALYNWLTAAAAAGFFSMILARAIGLTGEKRGWKNGAVLSCNLIGAVAAAIIIVGPPVLVRFADDPPITADCLGTFLSARLENAVYDVPVQDGAAVTVIAPNKETQWQRYLSLPGHRRDLCKQIASRGAPLRVAAIRLGGEKWVSDYRSLCRNLPKAWAEAVCETQDGAAAAPFDITLLGPEVIREDHTPATPSKEAFAQSRTQAPWKSDAARKELDGQIVHHADDFFIIEPDASATGEEVYVLCTAAGDQLSCSADEDLGGNVWVNWKLTTVPETAATGLLDEHRRVHRILGLMNGQG